MEAIVAKEEKMERVLRLNEFAKLVGYRVSTIRKKIFNREISYFRPGRVILVPESEVGRLLGKMKKAVVLNNECEKQ